MIHAKITPTLKEDGQVHILVEWVDVQHVEGRGPVVGEVQCQEEFQSSGKMGAALVSRVCFEQGEALPGTFWLDRNGARHFVAEVEPGFVGSFGSAPEMARA